MDDIALLRIRDVSRLVGLARSTIYLKVGQGLFPRPVKLAGGRCNAWRSQDVRSWIAAQVPLSTQPAQSQGARS